MVLGVAAPPGTVALMNWLLARIGFPKAIGIYIEDQAVHLSQAVATPWGPVQLHYHREDLTSEGSADALRRTLMPVRGRRRVVNVPTAIGVEDTKTYFSTRPTQPGVRDPSPHLLLREALQSSNVRVDEMVVDVVHAQPDKRHVASIVCCEKRYLKEITDSLQDCGVRRFFAEPTPSALLRAAVRRYPNRRKNVTLRVFLSQTDCLAVLAVKDMPIVWRRCHLPRGDEAAAMLSLSRSLITISRHSGIESELDVVMVHGRHDLSRLLDVAWMQDQIGAPVEWLDGPSLGAESIAFGLALGRLHEDQCGFDLAKPLKPQPRIWELFHWREMAAQATVLLCMALFLMYRVHCLDTSCAEIHLQNARSLTASQDPSALKKERNELKQKVSAVHRFLDNRVLWSGYIRNLSYSLPDNVFLTSFQGVSELKSTSKRKSSVRPNMSLVLRGAVSIPKNGVTPLEIDRVLEVLRAHPVFKRDFPVIELAGIKHYRSGDDALAMFTVMFMPKGSKHKRS